MTTKRFDEKVLILENKKVNGRYYKLTFRSPALSKNVGPGQFVQIKIGEGWDPYLRRPFSFFRAGKGRVEILYEILGRGTELLAQMKKGKTLKVMGPLGKGFQKAVGTKKRVLVAGGIGVPPLVFLAESYPTHYLLIGAKSKSEVLSAKELRKCKGKIFYSTDDGSYGTKGKVTVLLEEIIAKEGAKNIFIQTCGPKKMMQAVIQIARRKKIGGEASLDEKMACGMGACLGCMVKTPQGWMASCVHGPVFKFQDIEDLG